MSTPRFKDNTGRWVTRGLFKELGLVPEFIIMTLEEGRSRFIEAEDPTGVVFADRWLGGYAHWKALKKCVQLAPYIREWEDELEVRIRSKQIEHIRGMALGGHFQASKFLVDRGWDVKKAGRPSKEEVERETKVQARLDADFKADVIRLDRT